MVEGCGGCKDCKRVREHVASLLPFRVLEAAVGKPLRISGVALSAGISRNFNVYTVEELQAFADKLVGSPMYIEHVAVPNAVGKVTKTSYDPVSRCLMYEAEIYDEAMADKIRKGLVQHVSVGADYDTIDAVGAKVPHGLHNAELSLVAVPGIPEANIQVLERLRESLAHSSSSKLKISAKEILDPLNSASLSCVFCGHPGEYLVSVCTSCGDNAAVAALESLKRLPLKEAEGDLPSSFTAFKVRFRCYGANPCEKCKALDGKEFIYGTEPVVPLHDNCECGYEIVERLLVHVFRGREQLEAQVAGEYFLGFYQDPALFLAEHFRVVWLDQANGVLAVMAKTRCDPAVERCQEILFLKEKWQPNTVADWLVIHPDYSVPANGSASQAVQSGVEKLDKEELKKLVKEAVKEAVDMLKCPKCGQVFDYYQWQSGNWHCPNKECGVEVVPPEPVVLAVRGQPSTVEKLAVAEKELTENKTKLVEVEGKLADTTSKLGVAEKNIEDLRKQLPGGGLLVNPPKMMPVAEHVAVLEGFLPAPVVERSSMGMQRMCQSIKSAVFQAKGKLETN